jgi:outer membrane protein assembly factor BamB
MPLRRDGKIYCVDTETGKMLWAMTCWPSSSPIIADGRIIVYDLQDGMIHCYGKGDSATTVSAPQTVPALGSSVVITGTVTDTTDTGRLNTNAAGTSRFNSLNVPVAGDYDFTLKGTPAIGDESMDAWMEYKYHQRPMPKDAKGVEVSLDTVDPNGNYVHIATVTSDINGNYGYAYTPEVPGAYQIIATFAGSGAYGPSSATTYLAVGEAPPPTAPPPEYPQPIDYTMAIIGAVVVLLIAIAIVGILLYRKK